MSKRRMPELPDTGRHYVEQTMRARLASPGIEHFPRRRGRGVVVVALVAGALVAAMVFLR
jgi:hypothetical protein